MAKIPLWLQKLTYPSCSLCKLQFYTEKELFLHFISCNSSQKFVLHFIFSSFLTFTLSTSSAVISISNNGEWTFSSKTYQCFLRDLPTIIFANGIEGNVLLNEKNNKFFIQVINRIDNRTFYVPISKHLNILFEHVVFFPWV
jgi:hypothetical protein